MNQLTITEFKDIRVLTSQQIAESYETDTDTISKNFNNNKDRYTEGKHYILLQGKELREAKANGKIYGLQNNANKFYLWTEKGAFLHAKSLNTDKAWEAYDRLIDEYFKDNEIYEGMSAELKAIIMQDKRITQVSSRVKNLENNMTIDYGQQQVLKKKVNAVVVEILGGKNANAYKEMSKKVFSECNRDIQDYFNVNSRCNIPKLKFNEAVEYIRAWTPCVNTLIKIRNCNNQLNLDVSA
jgi:hypothetical protein